MYEPLLKTKFYPPPLPSNHVRRPHLIQELNTGIQRKLTLISAPAGFGKTILVSEWVEAQKEPIAWLSLDPQDDDSVRFWICFISALQNVYPQIGRVVLESLASGQSKIMEHSITSLINEIAQTGERTVLVLDDFHHIKSADVQETFQFLLDHQPPNFHLFVASRYDPPWDTHLLRSRQEMAEIRQLDLQIRRKRIV